MLSILSFLTFLSSHYQSTFAVCPYLLDGTPPITPDASIPTESDYNTELADLDIDSVFNDLYDLLLDSQECWPADEFTEESNSSYAGLMLRLAWHCAGTFRETDGRGGCAGGRQRYEPESSWMDNANLDKGRALLGPIKETYGNSLSWGDLFIFAGTASILQGGGPITQVCAGRIDNNNGSLSDILNDNSTCNIQGNCSAPLGASTNGLIYVDPEGYLGNPDPIITSKHIREIFGRMGMNDSETVALIGGGHAFGKSHGPCPNGTGPPPNKQPLNPWPGLCGNNLPYDIYTSGIEGQWTEHPFTWDNEYFIQLIDDEYILINGPGNKHQWENKRNGYLMLTTDIALINDDEYLNVVTEFANNPDSLDVAFSNAWEKLTTSGGNWADNKFCVSGESLAPHNVRMPETSEGPRGGGSDDDDDDISLGAVGIILFVIIGALFGGYYGYKRCSEERDDSKEHKPKRDEFSTVPSNPTTPKNS